MKKTKILQIITGLGVGGAEKVVYDLIRLFDKSRFDTSVVSLSNRIELLSLFRETGINVVPLYIKSNGKGLLRKLVFLLRFIRRHKFDIVHAHMRHSLIVALVIKLFFPNIKIVFTSHNINIGSSVYEALIQLTKPLRKIDIIFSSEMRNKMYINGGYIIPNAIDFRKYNKSLNKYERFTFISVGRLECAKNHIFLINLIKKLSRKDFNLLIVGEGYLRPKLEAAIAVNDLKDRVFLLGLRKDIPELLAQSHCFLLPSLFEGMPITLLEAGAASVPIISTPVGSIPSMLNEEMGFLSELEEFQDKMEFVMENYPEAISKAEKFKEKIQTEYSLELFVSRHLEVYSSL